jgi:hypothetical protein
MILGLVFRLFDYRPTLIKTAVGADPVRHHRLRASWALDHIDRSYCLVGSSFVPPCSRDSFLWYRHVRSFSVSLQNFRLFIVSPVEIPHGIYDNRLDDLI